jgi:GNAT superfamily N-acetyltransferase
LTTATIRPARLDDAVALHRHCYPEADPSDVRDYLVWCLHPSREDMIVRLVAEVNGEAVGNAQLTRWPQAGEIGSLVVAPAFRRQGIARRLISELINEARRRGLLAVEISVSERHPTTLAFYQELGFREIQGTKRGLSHSVPPEPVVQLRMLL